MSQSLQVPRHGVQKRVDGGYDRQDLASPWIGSQSWKTRECVLQKIWQDFVAFKFGRRDEIP